MIENLIAKFAVHNSAGFLKIFRYIFKKILRNRLNFTIFIGFVLLLYWIYKYYEKRRLETERRNSIIDETASSSAILRQFKLYLDNWILNLRPTDSAVTQLVLQSLNNQLKSYEGLYRIQLDSIEFENLSSLLIVDRSLKVISETESCQNIYKFIEITGSFKKSNASNPFPLQLNFDKFSMKIDMRFNHCDHHLKSLSSTFTEKPTFFSVRSNLASSIDTAATVNIILASFQKCQIELDLNQLESLKLHDLITHRKCSLEKSNHDKRSSLIHFPSESIETQVTDSTIEDILPQPDNISLSNAMDSSIQAPTPIVLAHSTRIREEVQTSTQKFVPSMPRSASDYGIKSEFLEPSDASHIHEPIPATVESQEVEDKATTEDLTLTSQIVSGGLSIKKKSIPMRIPDASPFQERIAHNMSAKKLLIRIVKAENLTIKNTSSAYCVVELHEPYQRHTTHVIPFSENLTWDQHLLFTLNSNSKRAQLELFELSKKKKSISRGKCEIILSSLLLAATERSIDNDETVNSTEIVRRLPLIPAEQPATNSPNLGGSGGIGQVSNITPGIGQLGPSGPGGLLLYTGASVAGVAPSDIPELPLDLNQRIVLAEFNFMERVLDEKIRTVTHRKISKSGVQSSGPSSSPSVTVSRKSNNGDSMPSVTDSSVDSNIKPSFESHENTKLNSSGNLTHSVSLDIVSGLTNRQLVIQHNMGIAATQPNVANLENSPLLPRSFDSSGIEPSSTFTSPLSTPLPRTFHRRSHTARYTSSKANQISNSYLGDDSPSCALADREIGTTISPGISRRPNLTRRITTTAATRSNPSQTRSGSPYPDLNPGSNLGGSSDEGINSPNKIDTGFGGNGSSGYLETQGLSLAGSTEEISKQIVDGTIESRTQLMPHAFEEKSKYSENGDLKYSIATRRENLNKRNTIAGDQTSPYRNSGSMGHLYEIGLEEHLDETNMPKFGSSFMRRLKNQKTKKRPSEGAILPSAPNSFGLLRGSLALIGPSSQLAGMAAGLSKWSDERESDLTEVAAQAQSTVVRGATGLTSSPSSPTSRSPSCSLSGMSGKIITGEEIPIPITTPSHIANSGQPAQFGTSLATALADNPGRFSGASPRRSVVVSSNLGNQGIFNLFKSRKKRFRSLDRPIRGADKFNYLDNIDSMDFDAISNEGYLRIVHDERHN